MLRVPLAVRIETTRADRQLQGEIDDLTFRKVAVGGHASARFTLRRPLTTVAPEIETYAPVSIIDTRNGKGAWFGRQADPGRSAGSDGQLYEITCEGPSAFLRDRTVPLIYIDAELSGWEKYGGSVRAGIVQADESDDGDEDVLKTQFPSGTDVLNGDYVAARNLRIHNAGLHLASISFTVIGGGDTSSFRMQVVAEPSGLVLFDEDLSTSGTGTFFTLDDWAFPADDRTRLQILRDGPTTTPDDGAHILWGGLLLQATRYTEYGVEITSPSEYNDSYIYAWQVVADVIGRLGQTYFDGADAFIDETGTHQVTQLAYPQGVTGAQVLDDMAELEPGFVWQATDRLANGKYRFAYVAKPTTVRYEADVVDGLEAQGDSVELYNEVIVRWKDRRGRFRTTPVTANVQALTARGLTRSYPIDLSADRGSPENATRVAQEFLAAHATPGNASRLTISRPILDITSGRTVQPWEIEPNTLIRVRGINARPDALQAAARDGSTIYYVAAVEYTASSNSAVLELDAYSVTTARAIAELRGRLDKAAL